jgi:TPR repeat protein
MHNLGLLMEDDRPAEATRWLRLAARQQFAPAMEQLARLAEPSDPAAAGFWRARATETEPPSTLPAE